MSIPVICDRCRSTGIAGEGDFSHLGDLLDFDPVPRKMQRVDGWNADRQRAFIAALAATGSKRQAALSIGMAPFGVDQMLKAEGNDSFKAAYERAMAIAAQNGSMKIALGVADAAARSSVLASARASTALTPPSRLRGLPSSPAGEGQGEGAMNEDDQWRLMEALGMKFMKKIAQEREARLAGEIVAADFYLRQITMIEVAFDLAATEFGWEANQVLSDIRRGDSGLTEIVSTPFSDYLDTTRRMWWAEEGEPERPPYPDARFIERRHSAKGEYATYADQHATGALTTPARGYSKEQWAQMNGKEQLAARKRQFKEDAAEQRAYEHRAYEQWRERASAETKASEGEGLD